MELTAADPEAAWSDTKKARVVTQRSIKIGLPTKSDIRIDEHGVKCDWWFQYSLKYPTAVKDVTAKPGTNGMSSKWSGWHVQCPSVPCLICPE